MVDVLEEGSVNIHSKKQQEEDIPSAHFFSFENEIALYKGESTSLARRVTLPSGTNALKDSELASQCDLPPFWRENSDLWFIQVEAFFYVYKIQSDFLRYNMVICKLDTKTIREVRDILRAPPISGKYDMLKGAIINRLGRSSNIQLYEYLMQFKWEGKKPSQIIHEFFLFAGNRIPKYIIDQVFDHIFLVKVTHMQPSSLMMPLSNYISSALPSETVSADCPGSSQTSQQIIPFPSL